MRGHRGDRANAQAMVAPPSRIMSAQFARCSSPDATRFRHHFVGGGGNRPAGRVGLPGRASPSRASCPRSPIPRLNGAGHPQRLRVHRRAPRLRPSDVRWARQLRTRANAGSIGTSLLCGMASAAWRPIAKARANSAQRVTAVPWRMPAGAPKLRRSAGQCEGDRCGRPRLRNRCHAQTRRGYYLAAHRGRHSARHGFPAFGSPDATTGAELRMARWTVHREDHDRTAPPCSRPPDSSGSDGSPPATVTRSDMVTKQRADLPERTGTPRNRGARY